jgi:hypothetical protein
MRITTFDLVEHKRCGIEVTLRRLAASPKLLDAASWQMLLDLVAHLQSSRAEHELYSQIVLQKLLLYKPEPPNPVRDRELKSFMDEWRSLNPDQATWVHRLSSELKRRFPLKFGIRVSVWVDWRDYAPLQEGLPEMHFRFQVKRTAMTITEDARARDPVEAERIICESFGW